MSGRNEVKIDAWVALIRAQRIALAAVQRALKEAGLPPLEWYDVLLELDRGGPLRPSDLQRRLLLAQYNLSRLLDRMEKTNLVERKPNPDDARSQWVEATAEGKAISKRMWPVYLAAINRAVGEKLTESQARQVAELLARIRTPRA
jgi:DNA-binding MarR family transcriptional regulator